jgi:hypothetical protein
MLAVVSSHLPIGMEGELVSVEVDIRRGLPGIDIVGLPDGAVRESKERVRIAIRNSAFSFPPERILISLAPASVRKGGSSFDLPIGLGILAASGQIEADCLRGVMVLGELNLGGAVRPVAGVLSAVGAGIAAGIRQFLVPRENLREACALGEGKVAGIGSQLRGGSPAGAVRAGGRLRRRFPGGPVAGAARPASPARDAQRSRECAGGYPRPRRAEAGPGGLGCRRTSPAALWSPGKRQDNGRAEASCPASRPGAGGSAGGHANPFHSGGPSPWCGLDPATSFPHAAPFRLQ